MAKKFHRVFGGAIILLLSCAIASAQPANTNRPVRRIIVSGDGVQPVSHTIPPSSISPDAFDNMVASAASFDMDSPVEAQAEFDPPVAVAGGHVVYRLTVSALDESLTVPDDLPAPAGIALHAGGRGQIYQPTGGMKLRPETTVIYRGIVTNTGTFTVPEFEVTAYGKPVKVPATTLTVTAVGNLGDAEPPHLLLDLPADDCYVGQLLRVGVMLPLQANGGALGFSQPHVTGDFIFSEQFSTGMRQETRQRDGKIFQAYVEDVLITPLRAGDEELVGQARSYVIRPNPVHTNIQQTMNVLVDSDPVTFNVKPLPKEGVLPGFTGAVGNFQVEKPRLSAAEIRAGEPVTLDVIIRGDGNLGRLTALTLPESREWQTFPPTSDGVPASLAQMRGYASFKYTLIPLTAAVSATPPIPFSYFDPRKKTYVDLTIPSVPIKVDPGAAASSAPLEAVQPPAPDPEFDDSNNHEKEPVLSDLAASPGARAGSLLPLQQHAWFIALQFIPAGALLGLWLWDRRRRFLAQHPEVILKRKARRGLARELRRARRAASAHDAAGFVTAGTDALREACAPHIAANPGALVCADVLQEMPAVPRGVQSTEMIRRFFAAADALRFGGPAKESSELLALQPDLEQLLEELRGRL
ncbi:MAG TPA: hypothetical protein VH413_02895 [Verrucomicrobiae bacterium]|nr:hypothetical protein [Verrucomicrobiae bacterium]